MEMLQQAAHPCLYLTRCAIESLGDLHVRQAAYDQQRELLLIFSEVARNAEWRMPILIRDVRLNRSTEHLVVEFLSILDLAEAHGQAVTPAAVVPAARYVGLFQTALSGSEAVNAADTPGRHHDAVIYAHAIRLEPFDHFHYRVEETAQRFPFFCDTGAGFSFDVLYACHLIPSLSASVFPRSASCPRLSKMRAL